MGFWVGRRVAAVVGAVGEAPECRAEYRIVDGCAGRRQRQRLQLKNQRLGGDALCAGGRADRQRHDDGADKNGCSGIIEIAKEVLREWCPHRLPAEISMSVSPLLYPSRSAASRFPVVVSRDRQA